MGSAGIRKKLFGDYIEIVISSNDEKSAKNILKKAYKEGVRLQKIFNFYDRLSVLSKLNRKRKLACPEELLEVLKASLKLCEETKGLYDISQGRNFLRRKMGEKIEKIKSSYKDININGNVVELTDENILIDLGSVAKGYIADKIGEFLKKEGVNDFVIDARGDILISGKMNPAVRVQHPRKKDEFIMTIFPKNSGVATSGDYNQYVEVYDNSHILNKNDFISVTVVAETLMQADLYATVFSVIKKEDMKKIFQEKTKMGVMTIDKNMKKEYYSKFKDLAGQ